MNKPTYLMIACATTLACIVATNIYPGHAQNHSQSAFTPQSSTAKCFMESADGTVIDLGKICGKPSRIKVNYTNQYPSTPPQGASSPSIVSNPEAPTKSPLESLCKSKDDCVEKMGAEAPPPMAPPIEGAFQG